MEQPLKALVVDDSLTLCRVLKEHLLHYGISIVDYCHSGEQALELIHAKSAYQYDALFIDLHMKGMDGLELMHELHKQAYSGGVIIVSALDARIVDYTLEVVSRFNLCILGSINKPIEKSLVAFMVRRIRSTKPPTLHFDNLPKRREVEQALQENNLRIHFQPIIDSNRNDIHALECLTFLDIAGRGLIESDIFLPVIEKFNLFELYMDKTFTEAAKGYFHIRNKTKLTSKAAFNLSSHQLLDNELPNKLTHLLEKNGFRKELVNFEITEKHSFSNENQQKNISRLRIHDFELTLDKYGAGCTNLQKIMNIPFNGIKIDDALINGMHKDKVLKVIIETISNITKELGIDAIAEGISNPHDMIMLDEIGIHLYQGYFFAKPKPADKFIEWHNQWVQAIDVSKAIDERIIDEKKNR